MAEATSGTPGNYTAQFDRHLLEIWSSTDPAVRLRAIKDLYATDAVVFEPTGEVHGSEAISELVGKLLAGLPSGFTFVATAPALGNHDMYILPWRGGPPENPSMLAGYDLVRFQSGLMKDLYVFINP